MTSKNFSSCDTTIVLILWKPFCFVVYDIRSTYLTGIFNGGQTSVFLQHMYASSHQDCRFSRKSRRLNKIPAMSTTTTRRNHGSLACRHITSLSQWKAVACKRQYPRHSGLRCRSIYRTLEPSYAQATCQLQALQKSTRHTGKDLPPLRRDSCVRKLTGWKIDDLASVAACGCVFHTPKWWIDRDGASLVIMVEVGRMDEWGVKATRVRASVRHGA